LARGIGDLGLPARGRSRGWMGCVPLSQYPYGRAGLSSFNQFLRNPIRFASAAGIKGLVTSIAVALTMTPQAPDRECAMRLVWDGRGKGAGQMGVTVPPQFAQMEGYWQALRPDGRNLPHRADFDPRGIADLL